jgi:hypothetical protein
MFPCPSCLTFALSHFGPMPSSLSISHLRLTLRRPLPICALFLHVLLILNAYPHSSPEFLELPSSYLIGFLICLETSCRKVWFHIHHVTSEFNTVLC